VSRLNEEAESRAVAIDQKEARRIAKDEYKLSKNPENFDAAKQDQHVDRVMKLFGASEDERAEVLAQVRAARDPQASAAATTSGSAQSMVGTESQPAVLQEVVVYGGKQSGFGQFLNEWQDPLATAGRFGTKVGQFIAEHSWAKWGLTAVEAITSPALFAGRALFESTELGKSFNEWLGERSEQVMAAGTQFVDDTGWIGNLQKSAEIVGGLMLGVGLVVGGAKLFTNLATKVGGFFRKLAERRAESRVTWVDENVGLKGAAKDYNDSAPGARSNIATKNNQAPALARTMPDGSVRPVKFDGVDSGVMVDRKLAVVTTQKAKDQALRQSDVLRQNGLQGRWEVPDLAQQMRAERMLEELRINNIRVTVVPNE
jgi:hypothetical protein